MREGSHHRGVTLPQRQLQLWTPQGDAVSCAQKRTELPTSQAQAGKRRLSSPSPGSSRRNSPTAPELVMLPTPPPALLATHSSRLPDWLLPLGKEHYDAKAAGT